MERYNWNRKTFNSRVIFVYILLISIYCLSLYKLAYLQIMDKHSEGKDTYYSIAERKHVRLTTGYIKRGTIFDRKGIPLAISVYGENVSISPSEIRDKNESKGDSLGGHSDKAKIAEVLQDTLNCDKDDILKKIDEGGYIPIKYGLSDSERKVIAEKIKDVSGERDIPGLNNGGDVYYRRFYPQGRLASNLIGYVSTSDDKDGESGGGENRGMSGVESAYDFELNGRNGKTKRFVDRDGRSTSRNTIDIVETIPARSVKLTIDSSIQSIVEDILRKAVKFRNAKGGICLVMDSRNGDILASAVMPDYDPNGYHNRIKSAKSKEDGELMLRITRNRAITDDYEPGSVFKTFTIASALQNGANPEKMYSCPSTIFVDGCMIGNASDNLVARNTETLADILHFSFNTGTANVALEIGGDKLAKTFGDFGFGKKTGIELAGESNGVWDDWKNIKNIDICTRSYGQSVTATPIQLCSAMQAIANKGVRMKPQIIDSILDEDGNVLKVYPKQEINRPIKPDIAQEVIYMLEGVIAVGTGKQAAVPGYKVAAKTGTADVPDPEKGGYAEGRHNSSILGIAPSDDPRIVVLVKLEDPTPKYFGGEVAGPIFRDVCREVLQYLGVPPTPDYQQVNDMSCKYVENSL